VGGVDHDALDVQEAVGVLPGEPFELDTVVRRSGGEGEDEAGRAAVQVDHGRMGGDQPEPVQPADAERLDETLRGGVEREDRCVVECGHGAEFHEHSFARKRLSREGSPWPLPGPDPEIGGPPWE
jgi:hypothetical protein